MNGIETFDHLAKQNMKEWDLKEFEKTFPRLYKTIKETIEHCENKPPKELFYSKLILSFQPSNFIEKGKAILVLHKDDLPAQF